MVRARTPKRIDRKRGGRYYRLPSGRKAASVTAITRIVQKPLDEWIARSERDLVLRAVYDALPESLRVQIMQRISTSLKNASAAQGLRNEAAALGTYAHKVLESLTKKAPRPERLPGRAVECEVVAQNIANYWVEMVGDGWKCIGCEVPVWSEQHEIAGTADVLWQRDDITMLDDLKTSSSIREEALAQVSAYAVILTGMGTTVDEARVVLIDKNHPQTKLTTHHLDQKEIEIQWHAFLAMHAVLQWQARTSGLVARRDRTSAPRA